MSDKARETLDCTIVRETAAARLLRLQGRDVWVPRSVTPSCTKLGPPEGEQGTQALVAVEAWFLRKEGL